MSLSTAHQSSEVFNRVLPKNVSSLIQESIKNGEGRLVMVKRIINEECCVNGVIPYEKMYLPSEITDEKEGLITYLYLPNNCVIYINFVLIHTGIMISFLNNDTAKGSVIEVTFDQLEKLMNNDITVIETLESNVNKIFENILNNCWSNDSIQYPAWWKELMSKKNFTLKSWK